MTPGALLEAVARETAATVRPVEGLATLLGDLVATLPADRRHAALVQAQAADLLVQRLEGLAQVVTGLAEGRGVEEILAELRLADLAAALRGTSAPSLDQSTSGDFALFE